jgi:hypothetical protein
LKQNAIYLKEEDVTGTRKISTRTHLQKGLWPGASRITEMLCDKKLTRSTVTEDVSTKESNASESEKGSKKMDRAISKMNGRDCGALGWE